MLEVDNIITLSNYKEYLLLDKTSIDGKDFFFAVGVDKNEEPNLEDYKFLEASKEDGKEYVEEVTDSELHKALYTLFVINYKEMAEREM